MAWSGPSTKALYPPVRSVASRSARRGEAATIRSTSASMASAASADHVTSQAKPSGPCSAWTTTSIAAHATGVVVVGDHHDLRGPGEGGGDAHHRPTPGAWPRPRSGCPGPAMTSTGRIDSVPKAMAATAWAPPTQ